MQNANLIYTYVSRTYTFVEVIKQNKNANKLKKKYKMQI